MEVVGWLPVVRGFDVAEAGGVVAGSKRVYLFCVCFVLCVCFICVCFVVDLVRGLHPQFVRTW